MKIAVSVDEDGYIAAHLGKSMYFNIYSKNGDEIKFIEERKSSGNHKNHIIEEIMDCKYVISSQIGEGMIENLKKLGIEPIIQRRTSNALQAVKDLH